MKVTYDENGVRFIRICDALQYWCIKNMGANVPVLIYKDVEDDCGVQQFRINILTPGTIIEYKRIKLPQDIRIKRKGKTLYTGSVIRTPKELLNEIILNLYSTDFPSYIVIEIE